MPYGATSLPHSKVLLMFSGESNENQSVSPNQKQPYTQNMHTIPNFHFKKSTAKKNLILGTILDTQRSSKNLLKFAET